MDGHRPKARQAGFVLISAVILLGLLAVLGVTYSRHVVIEREGASTSLSVVTAQEKTLATLEFARQALQSGGSAAVIASIEDMAEETLGLDEGGYQGILGPGDLTSPNKESNWTDIEPIGSTGARFWTRKLDRDGLGSTRLVEASWVPLPVADQPDALPRIEASIRQAILADSGIAKLHQTSSITLSDVELTGLVVLHDGVTLTLADDVVIKGAIVSAAALGSDDFGVYDGLTAPVVVLDGSLRIESQDFLPDVAMLLPNGVITTGSGTGNIHVEGDVVAHRVEISRSGLLDGSIFAAEPVVLGVGLDIVGAGRGPREPSSSLELKGPRGTATLAVVPRVTTLADYDAILDYEFP